MNNNEVIENNVNTKEAKQGSVMNVVTLSLSIAAIVLSTVSIGSNMAGNIERRPRTMAMQNERAGNYKMNQGDDIENFAQRSHTNRFGGFNGPGMALNRKSRQFMQNNRFNNENGRNMIQNEKFKNQNSESNSSYRSFRNNNAKKNNRQNQNDENKSRNGQKQNNDNRKNNVPDVGQNSTQNGIQMFPNN